MSSRNEAPVEVNSSLVYDQHVKYILSSRLLLDEDLECILDRYFFEEERSPSFVLSILQKVIGFISLSSGCYCVRQKLPVSLISISISPIVIMGARVLMNRFYQNRQKRNVEVVVDTMKKIINLNINILNFVKSRILSAKATNLMDPLTRPLRGLIVLILHTEVDVLCQLRSSVRELSNHLPLLQEDYAYLEDIAIEDFNLRNINNMKDACDFFQKLNDIFIVLVSNCLTCLALTLSPHMLEKYNIDADEVLDTIVPKLKNLAVDCYKKVEKKFDDVKYFYLNKDPNNKVLSSFKPTNDASRLYLETCNSLVHTNEVIEKSIIVFEYLKKVNLDKIAEKEVMSQRVAELRSQVFECYESLDILHKLYEISVNQIKAPSSITNNITTESSLPSIKSTENASKDSSLNAIEPTEDEEYELYIDGTHVAASNVSLDFEEEPVSRGMASLLNKELKQKLKTNARFVAARQKRGVVDEEDNKENTPPKIIQVNENELVMPVISNVPKSKECLSTPPTPPPPPPPFPVFDSSLVDSVRKPLPYLDAIRNLNRSNINEIYVVDDDSDDL